MLFVSSPEGNLSPKASFIPASLAEVSGEAGEAGGVAVQDLPGATWDEVQAGAAGSGIDSSSTRPGYVKIAMENGYL